MSSINFPTFPSFDEICKLSRPEQEELLAKRKELERMGADFDSWDAATQDAYLEAIRPQPITGEQIAARFSDWDVQYKRVGGATYIQFGVRKK